MSVVTTAYNSLSDLNLWLKIKAKDQLKLTDIPAIANLRFNYILENWNFIRTNVIENAESYADQKKFKHELGEFDFFVDIMRNQLDSVKGVSNNKDLIIKYYSVFDNMYINDLNLSKTEQSVIESETKRVLAFKKDSFIGIRSNLEAGRNAIADSIGATDETYNSIYNRSSLPQRLNPSISEIRNSYYFQQGINTIDTIVANETILNSSAYVDPFAFARTNANNEEIDINTYSSGYLVKLNYGEDLRGLAQRVMGDSNRWLEIAIANGLKPPYIDEVGTKIPLISNARGDTVNIAATNEFAIPNKENVYINQIVFIQSDIETVPDQRVILSIRETPISGELNIQLSGDKNLDKYKSSNRAYLRVFKPHTVNSGFYILIPSNEQVSNQLNKPTPWFLRSSSQDEKNAGIDLLLDGSGDIGLNNFGDFQLSYGVDNAVQALKILLSTPLGSLSEHPNYGVANFVGATNSSPDELRTLIAETISSSIIKDPRFDRLEFLTVEYISEGSVGPSGFFIKLGTVLSGSSGSVIPISFSINVPQ